MRLARKAICAVAFGGLVLVGGAACAEESAADAIAEKFSHAAKDSGRREVEAKKAEAEQASTAARKLEARRKAEIAGRLEARRKAEVERKAAEQRKADEEAAIQAERRPAEAARR